MTVHVLSIEHRHGTDNWVCATWDIAQACLADYVRTWWDIENGKAPADDEEAIDQYFDDEDDESYSIEELALIEHAPEQGHKTISDLQQKTKGQGNG